jgi:hypothetical protein
VGEGIIMGGRGGARKSKQGCNTEKARRKSQDQVPNQVYLCTKCEDGVEENQDCIECAFCKGWCHKSCTKLTEEKFKLLLKGGEEILWACEKCRDEDKQENKSRLEVKVDNLTKLMTGLMNRLVELEERRAESIVEVNIQQEVEKKVGEAFEEMKERESRKLNLILVNVPESEAETGEERQKEDIRQVKELVGKLEVQTGDLGLANPIRMGKRIIGKASKPRVLRITVKSEEAKKTLLAKANKLSEESVPKGKRVYISCDRTPKEREDYKKLREELLKRREEEPESNLQIRGGKIVRLGERKREDKVKKND